MITVFIFLLIAGLLFIGLFLYSAIVLISEIEKNDDES